MSVNYSPTEASTAAKRLRLDYTRIEHECYRVEFDSKHQLVVIGDLDNACYEWAIEASGTIIANSNCGYGETSIALRDGLIAFHGLGDQTEQVSFEQV